MLQTGRTIRLIFFLTDCVFILGTVYVPYFLWRRLARQPTYPNHLSPFQEHLIVVVAEIVVILYLFADRQLFGTNRTKSAKKEFIQVLACVASGALVVSLFIFVGQFASFRQSDNLLTFLLLCVLLGGWRLAKRQTLRKLIKDGFRNINVLLIGANSKSRTLVREIQGLPYSGLKVIGVLDNQAEEFTEDIPVLGRLSDFESIVHRRFIKTVFVSLPMSDQEVSGLVQKAKRLRLGTHVIPGNPEEALSITRLGHLGSIPLLTHADQRMNPSDEDLKRLFDVAVTGTLLVLFLPGFLVIAALIKLTSRGPVFFVQDRIGENGHLFRIFKFRSMIHGADALKSKLLSRNEAPGGINFKMRHDPRITRVGKFLRRFSMDEIPQLFNVLKGDMTLVGPRPPLASEIQQYHDLQMGRLAIKPGITGLSQTRGRSDLTFDRIVKWDIWYMNHWSFWFDVRILLQTIPAVLRGHGAY